MSPKSREFTFQPEIVVSPKEKENAPEIKAEGKRVKEDLLVHRQRLD